jgi:SAM-dependent methyltransferase
VSTWRADAFDLERDFYPYPNAHFKAVVCCDLLDTLARDPMHMLDEIHRILRPGCHLVLTTRRFALEQIRDLLENCGLEVTAVESNGDRVFGAGRKIGPLRERYPIWLYPNR